MIPFLRQGFAYLACDHIIKGAVMWALHALLPIRAAVAVPARSISL